MARKEDVIKEVQRLMDDKEHIRNIGIVAHIDHGKTTLSDSLLARSGLLSETIAGQARALDFEEEEQKRGITIKSANISLVFNYEGNNYLINLIDTPGHVDFGGHVTRAMRAVDGVVVVVCAVEGVMPQTETVLRQALKERVKPVLFINKVDRLIKELQVTPEEMQQRFIKIINKVNSIIEKNAPPEHKQDWKVSVQDGSVSFGSAFSKWAINIDWMQKANINFAKIFEYVQQDNQKELAKQVPVDQIILQMVTKHLPSPLTAQKYRIQKIWKGDAQSEIGQAMASCDPNAPAVLMITAVKSDQHAGEVATGRLFSGTLEKGKELFLIGQGTKEKVQQVALYMGADRILVDKVTAGNVVAVVGLKNIFAGETAAEIQIEPFEEIKHYSEPVVTKSIEAKDMKDMPRLVEVLRKLSKEDPTIKVEINHETGEHLISGMGELHLEIIEKKIRDEYKIGIVTSPPIVVYRETVKGTAGPIEGKSPNKHNRFYVEIEPLEPKIVAAIKEGDIPEGKVKGKALVEKLVELGMNREEAKGVKDIYLGNMFVDFTKGVQYLNEVMELLLQGFEEAMREGPLAKEKVTGVKVRLVDAMIHEDAVHRGPAQILPAIKRPIYAGILMADPTLLEPMQMVEVRVPPEFMGSVTNLLQKKRANIGDMTQEDDLMIIKGKAPVAEMFGFANDMRSATEGRALWSTEYAGYEEMPKSVVKEVVASIRKRKGENPEPPTPQFFLDL